MDIWSACAEGNLEYVKGYIDEGRDLNAQDPEYGGSPLTWASQYGQKKIVEILVENRHTDIEFTDENGRASLILASANGWENIVELLVKKGAQVDVYGDDDWTALMEATRNGHENIVRILVKSGADIESQESEYGMTALLIASEQGHENIVKFLAENGADIEAEDCGGLTATAHAFLNKHDNVVHALVEYGALMSSLVPQSEFVNKKQYVEYTAKLAQMCLERAVVNPKFGTAMQRDIENILGGETSERRLDLTKEDKELLKVLLKTLRSIDYTDRVSAPITEYPERSEWRRSRVGRSRASAFGHEDKPEEASPAYDMEL